MTLSSLLMSGLSQHEMGSRQMLVDTLHGKYIEGLANALDKNALKSRSLMRAAAYMHALTNEIFTIESATGFELNMGGTESTGEIWS